MDQRLNKYLESIITQAHGSNVPEALREKMIRDLAIQLENKLAAALVDQLPPADQAAYSNLVAEQPTNESVMAFFEQHLANTAEIVQGVLANFERDYISYMKS